MEKISFILTSILPAVICFAATALILFFLPFGKKLLGADRGRKFAVGSEVNVGKPTGVGFYFVLVIAIVSCIFAYKNVSIILTMGLMVLAMISGFLDDRAKNPWNEYVKGALDFCLALAGAAIATIFFPTEIVIGLNGATIQIHPVLYFILAVILIIVSINATNATDGVDGLSGTLTILTFFAFNFLSQINQTNSPESLMICEVIVGTIFAYLLFNFYPSKMLMGDAGSRALGLLIAMYAMYVRLPLAYLVFGLPFMIDGGLSILKITIGRLTKKKVIILKNTLTPIHDHLKKRKGLSVPMTMAVICLAGLIIDIIYLGITLFLHRGI
ncbi:MAG: phospho-N-acetylmuramoyl-pentapeptide-transferase [Clostridiales bacterium]|nr:phospho-N-acetylmuramoyl-pentapeptide-transferase [Clostridiales bacterium]